LYAILMDMQHGGIKSLRTIKIMLN
jgi:hypothetical protein